MLNQIKKINHFIINKKPTVRLVHKVGNEVVFFIKNEMRLKILEYLRKKLKAIYNIHVQTLFCEPELKSNHLVYHHKKLLTDIEKITIIKFIKFIIERRFNIDLNVKLLDYKQVWLAERTYFEEEFLEGLSKCLKTKEEYITPPLTKKTRKKLQELAMYYSSIKRSTKKCGAGKQVVIRHKNG